MCLRRRMTKKKVLSWGFGCLLLETEGSSKKVAKVWCRTCSEFYGQASSQPMLASSKEAVKKIQVFLLLEQLSSKRTILATIYLILTHLRHLVSFAEENTWLLLLSHETFTMVQSKKLWDGVLSKPHYVYFSTWETKLPHARHKRQKKQTR